MSTKFSAVNRYIMLQLPAKSPPLVVAPRVAGLWIVIHEAEHWHTCIDLLSTVCRVGGCKFSSISTDTRCLAKDFSSELQVCFAGRTCTKGCGERPPAGICVVCQHLLVRYRPSIKVGSDVTQNGGCLALLSDGSLTLKPVPSAFSSIVEEGYRRKNKHKLSISCCLLYHVLSAVDSRTSQLLSAVASDVDCRRSRFVHSNPKAWHHFGEQSGDDTKTLVV